MKIIVTFIKGGKEVIASHPLSKFGAECEARAWEHHFLISLSEEEQKIARTIKIKKID
jgi:hypothetical protein